MRQSKVTYKDWMEMHPWMKAADESVVYYVKLSNAILSELQREELPTKIAVQTACGFAAYLEDILSGRHILTTLQGFYLKKYNYRLPFFPIAEGDYYEDEVNLADVAFLYWHFLAQNGGGEFPSPKLSNEQMERVAKITGLLENAFEDAPESNDLPAFLTLVGVDKPQFNDIASRMVFLQRQTYLNHISSECEIDVYTEELKAEPDIDEASFFFFLNEYANQMLFNQPLSASGEFAANFYAALLGKEHAAYKLVSSIGRNKLSSFFHFVEEKSDTVVLEHPASKQLIEVAKESLPTKISNKPNWLCEVVVVGDIYYCVSDVVHPEEELDEEDQSTADQLRNIFESPADRADLLAKLKVEFDKIYEGKPFVFTGSFKKATEVAQKICASVVPNRLIMESHDDSYEGNCILFFNPKIGFELYSTFNLFGKKIIRGENANLNYPTFPELLTNNIYPKEFLSEILRQGWVTWNEKADDNETLQTYQQFLLDYYKVEPVMV